MQSLEERLKEKACPVDYLDGESVIELSDTLEILKDSYSKEEVIKLLRKQRKNCALSYLTKATANNTLLKNQKNILNAPQSPLK